VVICPLCRHEVGPIRRAHDVRKISAFGHGLAHRACMKHYNLKGRTPTDPIARGKLEKVKVPQ
jgi:hypothetical protein